MTGGIPKTIIPIPHGSQVACPNCGKQAVASFPLEFLDIGPEEIPAFEDDLAQRGHSGEINVDHHGRAILWYFPDLFNQWPSGDQGWPATLTVCECSHCGFRGKHRFSSAPLSEQWALDPNTRISYCPICGAGPWPGDCPLDEVTGSYGICDDCWCEYGDDDTPEHREKWLEAAKGRLSEAELDRRRSHMIMSWNVPQEPEWTYRKPVPLDSEGGMYMK